MDKLILENFKVFKKRTELELAPITILVGKNSSGKSSIIKALLLLADYTSEPGAQLVLSLLEKENSKTHRINKWINLKNWYSVDKACSIGYVQNDLEFLFRFIPDVMRHSESELPFETGQDEGESTTGILSECTISDVTTGTLSRLRQLSLSQYEYQVPLHFVQAMVARRVQEGANPEHRINLIKSQLAHLETRKETASSSVLVSIITEEQQLERQLALLNEQYSAEDAAAIEQDKVINTVVDVREDGSDKVVLLGHMIRRAIRNYYDEGANNAQEDSDSDVGEENVSTRELEEGQQRARNLRVRGRPINSPIPFRFTEELARRSAFAVAHLGPTRIRQARLYMRQDQAASEFLELINWHATRPLPAGSPESNFLNHWMKELGIGQRIEVRNIEGEGAAVKVWLKNKDMPVDLADLGYGIGQVLAILLAIMKLAYESNPRLNGRSMFGYRVIRPILMIEEAESNLHPNFQSKLAQLFVEANKMFGIQFVLESHSEYLVRKFQVMISNQSKDIDVNDVIIYYVGQDEQEITRCTPIQIEEDGSLSQKFPSGFFDEALGLTQQLYGL